MSGSIDQIDGVVHFESKHEIFILKFHLVSFGGIITHRKHLVKFVKLQYSFPQEQSLICESRTEHAPESLCRKYRHLKFENN